LAFDGVPLYFPDVHRFLSHWYKNCFFDLHDSNERRVKMVKKQSEPQNKPQKIEFLLYAPYARQVFLLGDFNQWDGKKYPMKKGKIGEWEKALMLPPGSYEYKYIVDGQWQEDPTNHQNRLNSFGTYNNLLIVED
jgi:1,4-alpha-glucan branching enzyme